MNDTGAEFLGKVTVVACFGAAGHYWPVETGFVLAALGLFGLHEATIRVADELKKSREVGRGFH